MTNGRGAGMASFMTKKKKYKWHVDFCLEELLEVPFVSAVLFAKLRLLDGGSFQDHSSREEVCDHKVKWGGKFSFPCKMLANASTGVLERCVLRISVRKESKGGRSFNKLGFVDVNLAEYAGAGLTYKKALLEGYDARHRQDNSMIKFSISMNMLSGDILFKAPSPSLKVKSGASEDAANESRTEDFSGGSRGGSVASSSSGVGSLPKKRPPLLSSDLVIGHNNIPATCETASVDNITATLPEQEVGGGTCETGHSRNSSNTSQLSKVSGYSSIHSHSHSRQSSSGDSGHIRRPLRKNAFNHTLSRVNTYPNRIKIPNTIYHDEVYITPPYLTNATPPNTPTVTTPDTSQYYTPPEHFNNEFYFNELQKSASADHCNVNSNVRNLNVISKSDFEIPKLSPIANKHEKRFQIFSTDSLAAILTPLVKRRNIFQFQSTPTNNDGPFKQPQIPSNNNNNVEVRHPHSLPETRTTSLNSLRSSTVGNDLQHLLGVQSSRVMPHRKLLLDNTNATCGGGKLLPVAPISPLAVDVDENVNSVASLSSDPSAQNLLALRRTSVTTNPSSSSLVISETGSLDRAKAAYERRKKTQEGAGEVSGSVSGRVENTRVNPDHLIAELLKSTNLEPTDDSAENSGLQLFIAKDGTASLGNHEVKSQMSTGVQVFKQVVMDDNR